jgi:prepilin-type N-terminal cleavage/methylation domain-containing protein
MKQNTGFTLLEVIVVVVLFSILVTFALPVLDEFYSSSNEKKAASDVLVALRSARSYSVSQNLEFRVAFDLDSQIFWLERGNRAEKSSAWVKVNNFVEFPVGLQMKTGASCNKNAVSHGDGTVAADNRIQFNPDGTCGSGGSASSRYICVVRDGSVKFRSGVPYSVLGKVIIDNGQ